MDVFTVIKRSPFVFPLACLAAVAMVFISEGSYRRSVNTLDQLGAMGEARTNIQSLQQAILDAETGQRGYLLTDRREYLVPYEKAVETIADSFRQLDRYYDDRPHSTAILDKLHALTATKLSELAETVRLHGEGNRVASRELMLSNIGKEQMEEIRKLGAELLRDETQNVAQSRAEVYDTLMLSRIGVAALSAISLLALFLYLRQSTALVRQQVELKRSVQAERDRLEIEVRQRTLQLTELARHLQTAREDERSRLARDLHDELGALLTSAKLDAARIKSRLAATAPEAQERLAHLVATLNSGIALKRRIIEDLRPSALSNLGLVATLEILTREYTASSGLPVHCALQPVTLPPDAELVVYRVVQEAITNVSKYAKARQVWVSLGTQADQVEVSVRDDGIGFDTTATTRSAHGLVGMRFRVESEGGSLAVESAPGRGTTVRARLPVAPAVAAAAAAAA
jgi:signal transduction histidine kinase